MGVIQRQFGPVSGLKKTLSEGRAIRGCRIDNASECTLWLRVGAPDPPASADGADYIIGPYTYWQSPIPGGDLGLTWTTDPLGIGATLAVLSPLSGRGQCHVALYNSPVSPESGPLASPPAGANPGQSLPYGALGTLVATGTTLAAIDATGWTALRIQGISLSTHPARIGLLINVAVPSLGNTQYRKHLLLGGGRSHTIEIPLPYLAPGIAGQQVTVTPTVYMTAGAGSVGIIPTLLMGLSPSASLDGPPSAFEIFYVQKTVGLGGGYVDIVVPNPYAYIYGARLQQSGAVAANAQIVVTRADHAADISQIAVEQTDATASALLEVGTFGPVDFENAVFVDGTIGGGANQVVALKTSAAMTNVQITLLVGP